MASFLSVSLKAFLFLLVASLAIAGDDTKQDKPTKKPKPRFTISKETTYVTGPVDKDGYIDYAAALNERLSKGVTPENNANVLIWQALGPRPDNVVMPPEFFKWMGIESPPDKGQSFLGFSEYLKERLKVDAARVAKVENQMRQATRSAWIEKEYPEVAGWLKSNEKPLAVVVEATKLPEFFSPLVVEKNNAGSSGLMGALLPTAQKCRELANVLAARAMLHAAHGRYDEAWQDLLACHRLARLVGRGASLIEGLVGFAIDSVAYGAGPALLETSKWDARIIAERLQELQRLPPMPAVADKMQLGQRLIVLDAILMIERDAPQALQRLAETTLTPTETLTLNRIIESTDWSVALRRVNSWYDRVARALGEKDKVSRDRHWGLIDKELRTAKKDIDTAGGWLAL
jgi:hypothetical protein